MNDSITKITDTLKDTLFQDNENGNVSQSERILSMVTGTYIFFKGITNLFSHPLLAIGEVALGGTLVHRGVTGYCAVKAATEDSNTNATPNTFVEVQIN